jgi:glycosyltransferase
MKISIITATYNSLKHLPASLQSISSQSYPNIEWIVVDGNSTDGTKEFIEANSSKIINWVSEADKGIYDALNKGISMANGDIIGFLHSDDFFASNDVIQKIIEKFLKEEIDGVYGDLNYISVMDVNKIIRKWKSRPYKLSLLKNGWMPAHPTLFLKKEVYKKHGQFDLNYKIAADYDFMLRILKDESLAFSYLPQVITNMRVGGASNKIENIRLKMSEDRKALIKNEFKGIYKILLLKNISKLKQFF